MSMAMASAGSARESDFAAIVATSERVAWTVDGVFRERRFDASRRIVPSSWVRTEHLAFLSEPEQLALNHIRAFSYAHVFGSFEEFIPAHLVEIVARDWHGERAHVRALLRFGDEEVKHQELMLRAEAVLESSCGRAFGRHFDPGKRRIAELTRKLLEFPPLPRFLLLAAIELGTRRHYVESVRGCGADADPLYADLLRFHWMEESQHIKTDVLEIARLASAMSAAEISAAFDQTAALAALVDTVFAGQVRQELATFARLANRPFAPSERDALAGALWGSMRAIFAEVGLTHPQFQRLARGLSREGAAKLGIR
jgi:hypothetical protein